MPMATCWCNPAPANGINICIGPVRGGHVMVKAQRCGHVMVKAQRCDNVMKLQLETYVWSVHGGCAWWGRGQDALNDMHYHLTAMGVWISYVTPVRKYCNCCFQSDFLSGFYKEVDRQAGTDNKHTSGDTSGFRQFQSMTGYSIRLGLHLFCNSISLKQLEKTSLCLFRIFKDLNVNVQGH